MGGVLNKPFLPSAADGRHIPERDERHAQKEFAEFDEDLMRRWISIAVFGGLVLVTGLLTEMVLARGSVVAVNFGFSAVILGVFEMFVGTFVAYVAYPPAIGWVALGSLATVGEGVASAVGGVPALWAAALALLVLGPVLVGVGSWRGIVWWNEIRREELGPTPS
ncbi:MAG TPA: hypothetical protein VMH38_06790 [Thermoplasmata archaeon]|nr:hypothetical protein [Thermoplasmata archaeon]